MEQFVEIAFDWGRDLLSTEVTKMTFAFLIAARLHRSWVRKDIAEQLGPLTKAINNVAETLGAALTAEKKRIDDLSLRVDDLETKEN